MRAFERLSAAIVVHLSGHPLSNTPSLVWHEGFCVVSGRPLYLDRLVRLIRSIRHFNHTDSIITTCLVFLRRFNFQVGGQPLMFQFMT